MSPIYTDFVFDMSAAAVAITVLVAAWTDWTSWRISNALVAGSAVAAMMIAVFSLNGIGFAACFFGGLVGMAIFMPLYLLGAMGAGDVKLMGAIGLHVGVSTVVNIALVSALIGGVWAIVLMDWRKGTGFFSWLVMNIQAKTKPWLRSVPSQPPEPKILARNAGMIPYGVVIAIGTLVTHFAYN